ncbi:MAG: hypothetical protein IPK08_05110 [Bacteroidetes bacterium]|nr:hypothetical protein [Bacteroidota bacterium]
MKIIRLMPNGDIDTNYRKISGFNSLVTKVSNLPSGDYLIGGHLHHFKIPETLEVAFYILPEI